MPDDPGQSGSSVPTPLGQDAGGAPPVPPWPTGRVSIIFTDIQGSTSLWEKLKDDFAPILELHNRIIREAIDLCNGYEVKTVGDAFMIAFSDALDALRCAVLMQELLTSQKWPDSTGELLVRVGIHTGEPIADVNRQTGRVDYFGPMVNMSARVESAAHGAQVLLSGATHKDLSGRLTGSDLGSIELADLGEHRLKGIDSPERIYQVISPRLPHRDFPPIATLTTLPTNLPYQQSTFVGREREIEELSALLTDPKVRAVTLSGPGGTGKTRLSLRLGNVLLDKFEGGVWVANLARAQTAEDVSATVAAALGLQLSGGEAPERVVANVLEYRKPLMLILDNFEQVAQHSAKTVGLWMSRAPKVKFLVTSQAVLALAGETEYRLGPLGVPPRDDGESAANLLNPEGALAAAAHFDSVKLFVERAREAMPAFALTESNSRDIMRICAELDGIPLALELAAARVKIMSPAQMVQRLTQKFQLLRSTRRDIPERHQTLNAAIEWSFELLSEWEKTAFEQACVFRGGFSLEAAEAVIDLSAHADAPFPMDAVQMLREKSLLTSRDSPQGVRFHMFRAMREWGESRFKLDGALVDRHAEYYTRYAQQWEALRVGPRMAEALDAIEVKKDNILAAIDRSVAAGKLARAAEAAVALAPTLSVRTAGAQRAASAEGVLVAADAAGEGAVSVEAKVRLLVALSRARQSLGEGARAEELAQRAVTLGEGLGDSVPHADALTNLAEVSRRASRLDEALALHERALTMCKSIGGKDAPLTVARNLGGKGMIHQNWGQHKEALGAFEEAERLNRKFGNLGGLAANLNNRGRLLRDMGMLDASLACFAEAEKVSRSIGDTTVTATVIANRHATLQATGDVKAAMVCCVQAERVFRELGDKANVARCIGKRGSALVEMGRLDEAAEVLTAACTMLRDLGQKRSVAALTSNLALVYVQQRKFKEARVAAEEFVEFCRTNKYIFSRDAFDGHVTLVNALLGLDDQAGARTAARRALQLAGTLKIHERGSAGMVETLKRLTEIARTETK